MRSSYTGINKHPLPSGAIVKNPNGSLVIHASSGRQFEIRRNGTTAAISNETTRASFTPSGKIRTVHTASVDIYRGPHGIHTIVEHRPYGVLVSTGHNSGYFQGGIRYNGQFRVFRTYVSGHSTFTRAYSPYVYHGVRLYHYLPAVFFSPDFYGWTYYNWAAPASYTWSAAELPWYPYYGSYFTFASAYPRASLWLTDFIVSQTLAAAYQMQQGQPNAPPGEAADAEDQSPPPDGSDDDAVAAQTDSPLTPELKQAIDDEVQQQLSYENAASSQPDDAPMLDDLPQAMQPNHFFVVSTPLNVATVDEQACNLSPGNVLRLDAAGADASAPATLTVAASRASDCPAGVQVNVALDQLQDMESDFRARLEDGLQTLHDQQGENGLPAAPQSAMATPPRPSGNRVPGLSDVAGMLQTEQTDAAHTELAAYQLADSSSLNVGWYVAIAAVVSSLVTFALLSFRSRRKRVAADTPLTSP